MIKRMFKEAKTGGLDRASRIVGRIVLVARHPGIGDAKAFTTRSGRRLTAGLRCNPLTPQSLRLSAAKARALFRVAEHSAILPTIPNLS
jgi:hypothetical protein